MLQCRCHLSRCDYDGDNGGGGHVKGGGVLDQCYDTLFFWGGGRGREGLFRQWLGVTRASDPPPWSLVAVLSLRMLF